MATPVLDPYVVPVTIGILVALFAFQRNATAYFGLPTNRVVELGAQIEI